MRNPDLWAKPNIHHDTNPELGEVFCGFVKLKKRNDVVLFNVADTFFCQKCEMDHRIPLHKRFELAKAVMRLYVEMDGDVGIPKEKLN